MDDLVNIKTNQQDQQLPQEPPPAQTWGFLLAGIGAGIIFLISILIALNYFKIISLTDIFNPTHKTIPANLTQKLTGNPADSKIIAKVGSENIYQKDLETELAYYPVQKNVDTHKLLLQKIEKDSIILQSGQAEGLIKLDNTVFNSLQKDYVKRTSLVKQMQKIITSRQDSISGSVISIWFENMVPAAVGYEKAKEIARSKITALYNDIKSKKLTIQQAAQEIQNDSGLAQVDVAYESNAIFDFKAGPNEKIVFDPAFDALIRKLQPGDLSPVYLAKDTKTKKDAVYMIAQVSGREASGHPEDFDQWYAQKEKAYEIKTY